MAFESATPATQNPWDQVTADARRESRHRTLTYVAVIAVLVLGFFAASWQVQEAGNAGGGNILAGLFGEGLVYGLAVYALVRVFRKTPSSLPAVLAALAIVGTVNYKVYAVTSEDRALRESLVKAMPLMRKVQSGVAVTDQEVRDGRVGMMEPMLLAQAANARAHAALSETYLQATSALQLEQILEPASLASPASRTQARARLKQWQEATARYKTQFDAEMVRSRQRMEAAQAQMPAGMVRSMARGFDKTVAQTIAYVDAQLATDKELGQVATGILDLLEANPGSYSLRKGPPELLVFRDAATLERYNALIGQIRAAGQRTEQAANDHTQSEAAKLDKLKGMLNQP